MLTVSTPAISASLESAFRAAFLLTGSLERAQAAVLNGIAGLECSDTAHTSLMAVTVGSIIQQHATSPMPVLDSLTALPEELRRVLLLAPVSRDCILLRVLFGVPAVTCAAILGLSIPEFEESLCTALKQLVETEHAAPFAGPHP